MRSERRGDNLLNQQATGARNGGGGQRQGRGGSHPFNFGTISHLPNDPAWKKIRRKSPMPPAPNFPISKRSRAPVNKTLVKHQCFKRKRGHGGPLTLPAKKTAPIFSSNTYLPRLGAHHGCNTILSALVTILSQDKVKFEEKSSFSKEFDGDLEALYSSPSKAQSIHILFWRRATERRFLEGGYS